MKLSGIRTRRRRGLCGRPHGPRIGLLLEKQDENNNPRNGQQEKSEDDPDHDQFRHSESFHGFLRCLENDTALTRRISTIFLVANGAGVQRREKVVALVVNEDEGREIFDGDFPNRFHAQFRECDHLLRADVILRQQGRRPPR